MLSEFRNSYLQGTPLKGYFRSRMCIKQMNDFKVNENKRI